MRKFSYYVVAAFLTVSTLVLVQGGANDSFSPDARQNAIEKWKKMKGAANSEAEEEGGIPLRDRLDLAMEQEEMRTKDPATGTVPRERLIAAKAYADELRASGKINVALSPVWRERGPSNVAGRTRAILIDPNDATRKTVFAGSVGGGIFKTTDITATPPVWTPVNSFMANLAVASLAADPSNPLVMYAGTGEGYFNSDAIRGAGIFKSTDGGTTWAQLASTTAATFRFVQRIAVTSTGVVLACTQSGGIQRSTNGGTTWAKVLGTGLAITGAASNFAYDVEIAANGDVYGTLDGSVHKSTNAGATFNAAMTMPFAVGRVELAAAPSDANYLYGVVENANVCAGFIRTTDAGATWTARTEPADADGGIPATDFTRGQAWYDLAIAVDPNNRDRVLTGGVDLFASNDGAGTWSQIAHWYGGFGQQYVHADQHAIVFQPGSSTVCYFGNDGGVWRTGNANGAPPTIAFKGDNYNVTQFYACAMHPTALTDYYLAGAQDNGSQQFNSGGIDATVEATGGDGAFCHIDQDQSQFQWTSYVYNDYYRSADGGNTWTNVTTSGGQFINPSDYDNVGNRMYACQGNSNYVRWDNPQTGATFATVSVPAFGGTVNCVTVSPNTANRVFFGILTGAIFRVDNAHTATPTATSISTGLPGGVPSCIEVQIGNDNHLLVTYTNYGMVSVWESTNGGTSWTNVEGNLPDMPVRWALFNPGDPTQALLATELGVWYTDLLSAGATVWNPGNSGLANVRVDMLQLRTSDNLVAAATHGRGLFTSDVFTNPTALFTSDHRVQYTTRPVQFLDQSYRATSWAWNFGDGGTSTAQNPSYTYASPGLYNVTLTINSGASTLTKNGWIQILPDLGTPYAPAAGGNFEAPNQLHFGPENNAGTPWERGNSAVANKNGFVSSSNSWVTGLVGNYVNSTEAILYGPSHNFTAPGTYTLRFQTRYATENDFDGYRVEYTTNKGVTWTPLGTTTAAGWYNNANASGTTIFPAGQAFFGGAAGAAFALKSRDVSFLAGNSTVAFRFVFGSDGGVVAAGAAIDDYEILGPGNPGGLPVTFSPLVGSWESAQPKLAWTTYAEQNTRGFAIERSTDGNRFQDVAFVDANGNSTTALNYGWDDNDASESHYYYRLRAVDYDGAFQYTNTVELRKGDAAIQIASIFPNPFRDVVTVQLSSAGTGMARAELFDIAGRRVYDFGTRSCDGGSLRLENIDVAPGAYMLRVTVGTAVVTRRVVRQ